MDKKKADEILIGLSEIRKWAKAIIFDSPKSEDLCELIIEKSEFIEYLLKEKESTQ